jgi:hypothetical protein
MAEPTPGATISQESPYVLGRDNVVGTTAGAITLLVVYAAKQFGIDVPVAEAMAIQLLVQSAFTHFTAPMSHQEPPIIGGIK